MNYIEYKGKQYKTRELSMIEKDWGEVTRTIAGEDLYDAITKNGEDDTYMDDDSSEEYSIDNQIYHYVQVGDLDKSGEEICKSCLDMEFEFVPDYSGCYSSIYDFIDQNYLKEEADKLFGEDWEAENDVEQIKELANGHTVGTILENTEKTSRADDYISVKKN